MGAVIAAVVAAAERRIIHSLEKGGALSPATAVPVTTRSRLEQRRLDRLEGLGIVVRAPGGGCYLDRQAWAAYRQTRRRHVWFVLLLALGVALLAAFLFTKKLH